MNHPLYREALLAWREELERQRRAALEDKRVRLRGVTRRELEGMFGPECVVELEDEDDPDDCFRALSAVWPKAPRQG